MSLIARGFRFYRDALRRSANLPMVVPADVRQYRCHLIQEVRYRVLVIKTPYFHPFPFNWRRCWRRREIYVDESHKRYAARILFSARKVAAYSRRMLGWASTKYSPFSCSTPARRRLLASTAMRSPPCLQRILDSSCSYRPLKSTENPHLANKLTTTPVPCVWYSRMLLNQA